MPITATTFALHTKTFALPYKTSFSLTIQMSSACKILLFLCNTTFSLQNKAVSLNHKAWSFTIHYNSTVFSWHNQAFSQTEIRFSANLFFCFENTTVFGWCLLHKSSFLHSTRREVVYNNTRIFNKQWTFANNKGSGTLELSFKIGPVFKHIITRTFL